MNKGVFITLEGCEGVGKSTNIAYIESWLKAQQIEAIVTREPGGTEVSEQIREILATEQHITTKTELLLIFAARAQHVETLINPALESGKWVVCDRFTDASYAYQGGGRGIAQKDIAFIEQFTLNDLKPDLTFLFDLPVEVGLERVRNRGDVDRWEQAEVDFFRRAHDTYIERAHAESNRFVIIDANQSVEQIQQVIEKKLKELLPYECSAE